MSPTRKIDRFANYKVLAESMALKSMKRNSQDKAELMLCLALLYFITSCQDPFEASIIVKSTLSFGGLYAFLRETRVFHPRQHLSYQIEAEWRSRQLALIHAVILTVGSIFCFLEWPDLPEKGDWFITKATRSSNEAFYTCLFTSIFLGYLHWDLLWLIHHRTDCYDLSSMVHHVLYISISHYLLIGDTYYFIRPYAWLSFTELSTPFLHLRWFMLLSGKKNSKWYKVFSICFALTFLFTRVFLYTFGLIDLWQARNIWLKFPMGIYLVVAGLHLGFALNLFWAKKVLGALRRAMLSG